MKKITITNRIKNPKRPENLAQKYLEKFKTRFPAYTLTNDKVYNGIVVEVDDDDVEDFAEALAHAGFVFEVEEDEEA